MQGVDVTAAVPAIGSVFVMAVIGYISRKRGLLSDNGLTELTRVLVDFILPCTLFHAMFSQYEPDRLVYIARSAGVQVSLFSLGCALAWLGHRTFGLRSHRGTVMALCSLQNNVYLPLPLALVLLSGTDAEKAQFYIGSFVMFFNPLLWTVGGILLSGGGAGGLKGMDILRRIVSPPVAACASGVALKALCIGMGWQMPEFVLNVTHTIGAATVPLAMIVMGAALAAVHWSRDFEPRAVLLVMAVKMILLPAAALLWLRLRGGWDPIFNLVVLIESATPPATNTALAAKRYGGNISLVALILFVTYLFSLVTLPFWIGLL